MLMMNKDVRVVVVTGERWGDENENEMVGPNGSRNIGAYIAFRE